MTKNGAPRRPSRPPPGAPTVVVPAPRDLTIRVGKLLLPGIVKTGSIVLYVEPDRRGAPIERLAVVRGADADGRLELSILGVPASRERRTGISWSESKTPGCATHRKGWQLK